MNARKLILSLLFSSLSSSVLSASDDELFAYAAATYPSLFPGTPTAGVLWGGALTAGSYLQFNYVYFPTSQNYLAIDPSSTIWVLGPASGNIITSAGPVSAYSNQITTWEATQPTALVSADITIDASARGTSFASTQLGVNFFYSLVADLGDAVGLFQSIGTGLLRYPGGFGDSYHWQQNFDCNPLFESAIGYTFDQFVAQLAQPLGATIAIGAPYGSNLQCNGPADPAETADWVHYANNKMHYGIKYWSIGNEVYFPGSYDLHQVPNDPVTYASAVANQYYPLMKAADPTINVGIIVTGEEGTDHPWSNWDSYVMRNAKYDFVEMHYYVTSIEYPLLDTTLLRKGVTDLPKQIQFIRQELAQAGRPNTPIFIGEFNSPNNVPGKQSVSIVNGLFMGMVVAESIKAGVMLNAAFTGFTNTCWDGPMTSNYYGWQTFGTYSFFSHGSESYPSTHISWPVGPMPAGWTCSPPPYGTPFPTARAYQVLSNWALPGQSMLSTTVGATQSNVRAYGATTPHGFSVLLFNIDPSNTISSSIKIANSQNAAFNAQSLSYGKAQYDQSKNNVWSGPVSQSLGKVSPEFSVALPPYSVTLITLTATP